MALLNIEVAPPTATPNGSVSRPKTPHISTQPSIAAMPAKREDDDEVQFVSSTPVKKRKVSDQGLGTDMAQASSRVPLVIPCPLQTESTSLSTVAAPSDTNHSTGMLDLPWGSLMPESSVIRRGSVPTLEKFTFAASFSSAPAMRPRSSPALSPKQLPEQTLLTLFNTGAVNQAPEDCSKPRSETQTGRRFSEARRLGLLNQLSEALPLAVEPDLCQAGSGSNGKTGVFAAANSMQSPSQMPQASVCRGALPRTKIQPLVVNTQPSSLTPSEELHAGFLRGTFGVSKVAGTGIGCNQPPITPQPACELSLGTLKNQQVSPAISCSQPSKSPTKAPCLQCLQARLRHQAAVMNKGITAVSHPLAAQTGHGSNFAGQFIQGSWDPSFGTVPCQKQFTTPMFSQFPRQPNPNNMASQASSFAASTHMDSPPVGRGHQPRTGYQKVPIDMRQLGEERRASCSNQVQNAPPIPVHRIANSSKSTPLETSVISRTPQTQLNGKHIIVDIADTCLAVFPFEEVAQRHHQSPQKVKDMFEAVIQVPLLRCATDKRRAGKLGTARVREFNQARKELQTNFDPSQQERSKQQQQHPSTSSSAWEIAQFMGPAHVRPNVVARFPGP